MVGSNLRNSHKSPVAEFLFAAKPDKIDTGREMLTSMPPVMLLQMRKLFESFVAVQTGILPDIAVH